MNDAGSGTPQKPVCDCRWQAEATGIDVVDRARERFFADESRLEESELENWTFEDCEIERFEYEHAPTIVNCALTGGTKVHSISRLSGTDTSDIYDPEKVKAQLARLGFTLEDRSRSSKFAKTQGEP